MRKQKSSIKLLDVIRQSCLDSCLQKGLQAIKGQYRKKIISSAITLNGSVDMDQCLQKSHQNDPRWDYLIAVKKVKKEQAIFVEIHPAVTNEIKRVIKKKEWLLGFVKSQLPMLLKFHCKYFWLATQKVKIPTHTPQYRLLQKAGLKPLEKLEL